MQTEIIWSDGAWMGHVSYLLLIASMLSRPLFWLRIGVIGSAIAGILYAAIWLNDWVIIFWEGLLLLVNLIQLLRYEIAERRARFTDEELTLKQAFLSGLARSKARDLIDQGHWVDGMSGQVLTREDEAISHLVFLSSGGASVALRGEIVGHCGPGNLIGDATALSGEPASGTVTLSEASRFWCMSAPALRDYLEENESVRPTVERHINAALQKKLRIMNEKASQPVPISAG